MRDPRFYPDGPAAVDVRETAISWVFLVRDRAYKLKKPVVLPFLDYSTRARRRELCRDEVRLNRRLAPDIYLGVWSIVRGVAGPALREADVDDAIDYVVVMRRFGEHETLASGVRADRIAPDCVNALAARLAAFHGAAPAVRRGAGELSEVKRQLDETFQTLAACLSLFGPDRFSGAERFVDAFLARRAATIVERSTGGHVREGHGDLRAQHVLCRESRVEVIDCVEFDPALRTVDVGADLSFLVMDLERLGAGRLGRELLAAYRRAGGDPGDDSLVAFHAASRAWVRAKVACIRAGDPARPDARSAALAEADELFSLGERFAWRSRLPLVIVVCGPPASGKSHLAGALAEAAGLPLVGSDSTRKERLGLDPTERAPREAYSDAVSRDVYGELGRRAAAAVGSVGGMIVDATFHRASWRAAFRRAMRETEAPIVYVECRAPVQVRARRARLREQHGDSVSDADASVAARLGRDFQPLDEVAPDAHVLLRTDRGAGDLLVELSSTLDLRLESIVALARGAGS